MAANLAIVISARDLSKAAIDSVKGGLDGMESAAGRAGTAIAATAAGLGLAIAGIGAAVVTAGFKFNSMQQQAEIAFTTMLGSGEKAKAFLDDLKDFAAKTPFEFKDLVMASQRLLAMGFAAKDVRPTLTAIGDAVAALGGSSETVGRVTTALGQMKAKGKVSAEEMMQLTEAGIPAWQMLADAIGKSVPEVMKDVTKGAVSADTAIAALVAGMNSKFGGMMDAQSRTFGGLLSTLKDTFDQVSGQVTQPFFDLVTQGMQKLVDVVGSPAFIGGVKAFADGLASLVAGAVAAGQAIGTQLGPVIQALFDYISFGVEEGDWWNDWITHLPEIVRPAVAAIEFFVKAFQAIGTAIQTAMSGDVGGAVSGLVGSIIAAFQETAPHVILEFSRLFGEESFGAVLIKFRDFVTGWITDTALPAITTALGGWKDALVAWAPGAWDGLLANLAILAANVATWATDTALPAIVTKLAEWKDAFVTWIGPAWETLKTNLDTLSTNVTTWATETGLPALQAKLAEWRAAAIDWADGTWEDLKPKLEALLASTATWISENKGPIAANAAEWAKAFGAAVIEATVSYVASLDKLQVAAENWVKETGYPKVKEMFLNLFSEAGREAGMEAGGNIAQGIIGGITGALAAGFADPELAAKTLQSMGRFFTMLANPIGTILTGIAGTALAELTRDLVNEILRKFNIPGITIATGVGGGSSIGGAPVRAFASGGIVTKPTFALIGEAGPEAVVPLNGKGGVGGEIHIHFDGPVYGWSDFDDRVRAALTTLGRLGRA